MRIFRLKYLSGVAYKTNEILHAKRALFATNIGLYTVLALAIFSLLTWFLSINLPVHVEAKGAIVSLSGIRDIRSMGEGKIVSVKKKAGDVVSVGDIVAIISNPQAEFEYSSLVKEFDSRRADILEQKKRILTYSREVLESYSDEIDAIKQERSRYIDLKKKLTNEVYKLNELQKIAVDGEVRLNKVLVDEYYTLLNNIKKLIEKGSLPETEKIHHIRNHAEILKEYKNSLGAQSLEKFESVKRLDELISLDQKLLARDLKIAEVENTRLLTENELSRDVAFLTVSCVN
ncbi:hypothetical protein JCM19238_4100 [Vibrio ponticus]|nr:hypothetical protein JCM19238_4100 [Vibrio ponticus]